MDSAVQSWLGAVGNAHLAVPGVELLVETLNLREDGLSDALKFPHAAALPDRPLADLVGRPSKEHASVLESPGDFAARVVLDRACLERWKRLTLRDGEI